MRKSCIITAEGQHKLLRSLKNLIEPRVEVSSTTDNVLSLLDAVESLTPDLVIVVITYSSLDKQNFVRHLCQRFPTLVIIIVSNVEDSIVIDNAVNQNIKGYVLLQDVKDELLPAIDTVLKGKTSYPAAYTEHQR